MRQGADLKLTARVHEVKAFDRGPKVLVLQVNHGKDKDGKFRPSSFFNVKVFPSKEQQLLTVRPEKGDIVEAICWGSTSEWTNKDGVKQRTQEWALAHLEMVERAGERGQTRPRTEPIADVLMDIDDIPF